MISGSGAPSIFKQANAPDQTQVTSGSYSSAPTVNDLWVDIINGLLKICTQINPYVWVSIGGGGGSNNFAALTSGTNTGAAMVVGTGASLGFSGSGAVNASQIDGITVTNSPGHTGEVLISQPGNTTAAWADPLVQGIQAAGTATSTVNPVLVAGQNGSGNLQNLATDSSGNVGVNVQNFPATQAVAASGETSTIYNGATALTPLFSTVGVSASGATTIINAVASKKIRVVAMQLVANAAVNVKWQSHVTPTDITGLAYLGANGGYVLPYNPVGWFQTIAGEALDINLSGAVAVGGSITYVTV